MGKINMLNKLALCIANRLEKHNTIDPKKKEVYVYGLELIISFLFSTSLVILIGTIMGKIIPTIIFLIVYILLRSYSGGYHANSYWLCTVVTLSVYMLVILLATYITVNTIVYIGFFTVGVVLLYVFAPIENINKEILPKDARRYKYISIVIFVAFSIIGFCLLSYEPLLGNTIFYTLCADIINIIPYCKFKNRKSNERRTENA